MRKKIFHSFLTLTCLVLAIFTAVLVMGVYQLEQRQLESSLQSETEMLASVVAGSDDGAAQLERLALDRRVTLVNADGSVAFDNYASAATLENHGGREEIVQAHTSGEATAELRHAGGGNGVSHEAAEKRAGIACGSAAANGMGAVIQLSAVGDWNADLGGAAGGAAFRPGDEGVDRAYCSH